jgi:hypothetical protein
MTAEGIVEEKIKNEGVLLFLGKEKKNCGTMTETIISIN